MTLPKTFPRNCSPGNGPLSWSNRFYDVLNVELGEHKQESLEFLGGGFWKSLIRQIQMKLL
jgi:hypothetical protein